MPTWPTDGEYPLSTTKIKDFPSGWQDILDILADAIARSHVSVGSTNQGEHQNAVIYDDPAFLSLTDAATGAPAGEFRIGIDGAKIAFQGRNSADTGWEDLLAFDDATTGIATIAGELTSGWENLPEGVRCIFEQASAPTGWTQVTEIDGDSITDRCIRVVGSASSGGDVGGSWSMEGWSLSLSGGPADHTHVYSFNTSTPTAIVLTGVAATYYARYDHKHTVTITTGIRSAGEDTHTHDLTNDGTWRPEYVDILVASRDAPPEVSI